VGTRYQSTLEQANARTLFSFSVLTLSAAQNAAKTIGTTTMSRVELRIESILAGAARRWTLYAVPCAGEGEVERLECHDLGDLECVLIKLRRTGVSDLVLLKARAVLVERNVPYVLGAHEMSQEDRKVLGLEPVTGVTRSDLDDFPWQQGEQESQLREEFQSQLPETP
jgi:hypothetical protein